MSKSLLVILFLGLMVSCIPQKKVIYLQKEFGKSDDLILNKKTPYKVRPQDLLQITITSLNPAVSEFFNVKPEGDKESLRGYTVSDSGYIYLPVLDSVKVIDMTISEIQGMTQQLIKQHVMDATVIVKLARFNFTVLGEASKPGLHSYDGTELTILEAIGIANDITDFGNKKKVRLFRKEGNSTRFISLDLTDRNLVASEYFYLQPNDVIYIEPLRAKNFRLNVGQLSLIVGFTSIFFFILNAVQK